MDWTVDWTMDRTMDWTVDCMECDTLLHPQYKFTFLRLLGNYVVIMM